MFLCWDIGMELFGNLCPSAMWQEVYIKLERMIWSYFPDLGLCLQLFQDQTEKNKMNNNNSSRNNKLYKELSLGKTLYFAVSTPSLFLSFMIRIWLSQNQLSNNEGKEEKITETLSIPRPKSAPALPPVFFWWEKDPQSFLGHCTYFFVLATKNISSLRLSSP